MGILGIRKNYHGICEFSYAGSILDTRRVENGPSPSEFRLAPYNLAIAPTLQSATFSEPAHGNGSPPKWASPKEQWASPKSLFRDEPSTRHHRTPSKKASTAAPE